MTIGTLLPFALEERTAPWVAETYGIGGFEAIVESAPGHPVIPITNIESATNVCLKDVSVIFEFFIGASQWSRVSKLLLDAWWYLPAFVTQ